jgi:hypothetical protein
MVSSTRLVCSARTARNSAILFARFWRRKVLEWSRRFYKPVVHCSIVEFLFCPIYCTLGIRVTGGRGPVARHPPHVTMSLHSRFVVSPLSLSDIPSTSPHHCDIPSWGRHRRNSDSTPRLSLLHCPIADLQTTFVPSWETEVANTHQTIRTPLQPRHFRPRQNVSLHLTYQLRHLNRTMN